MINPPAKRSRLLLYIAVRLVVLGVVLMAIINLPSRLWMEYATSVHIMQLEGELSDDEAPASTAIDTAHLRGRSFPVVKKAVLSGAKARELGIAVMDSFTTEHLGAMCHDPGYELRFYLGPILTTKTSLCFHCQNAYVREGLSYRLVGLGKQPGEIKVLEERLKNTISSE